MVQTPESKIKKEIKEYIKSIGGHVTPVTGGPFGKSGEPDMVVCLKGKYIGIEGKTPTGVQSDIQKLREKQILDAGGIYILARSVEDVRRVCESL